MALCQMLLRRRLQHTSTFVSDDVEPEELVESKTLAPDLVDAWLDLSGTIYVPGLLHICHNCVKDLGVVLSSLWEAFVGELRHVCRLLSRKRSNERLLATCVTGQYAAFHNDFKAIKANVYTGRWGAVAYCVGSSALYGNSWLTRTAEV